MEALRAEARRHADEAQRLMDDAEVIEQRIATLAEVGAYPRISRV